MNKLTLGDRIMDDNQRMMLAMRLQAMADALLLPVAGLTGLPPAVVQGFVEGTTTGAVDAGKAKGKKRKASAYSKAYGRAYKRLKKKHPRTKHATLVKRAHAEAKRSRK